MRCVYSVFCFHWQWNIHWYFGSSHSISFYIRVNQKLKLLLILANNDCLIAKEKMLGNFWIVKRKVIMSMKRGQSALSVTDSWEEIHFNDWIIKSLWSYATGIKHRRNFKRCKTFVSPLAASYQDTTLFQFSSKLWQLISIFQYCLPVFRSFSYYLIYSTKIIFSISMISPGTNMQIVNIQDFTQNLILNSQSIFLTTSTSITETPKSTCSKLTLDSLSHIQIMAALLHALSQWMVLVFSFSVLPRFFWVYPWAPMAFGTPEQCHAS